MRPKLFVTKCNALGAVGLSLHCFESSGRLLPTMRPRREERTRIYQNSGDSACKDKEKYRAKVSLFLRVIIQTQLARSRRLSSDLHFLFLAFFVLCS